MEPLTYWKDAGGIVHVVNGALAYLGTRCRMHITGEDRGRTYQMRDGADELVTCGNCARRHASGER